jgi:putative cardiolipin synthase
LWTELQCLKENERVVLFEQKSGLMHAIPKRTFPDKAALATLRRRVVPRLEGKAHDSPVHMKRPVLRAFAAVAAALLAAGCATMPGTRFPKQETKALDPAVETHLRQAFEPAVRVAGGNSGFRLLSLGIDGLLARTELIDAAERTLDLQYYIFHADESGDVIVEALLRAADRGVRVRILVDEGEAVRGDEKILALAAYPKIEVRVFNPFRYRGHNRAMRNLDFLIEKRRLDYRMHNKLLVADNAVALIGGRNIGDQYFQIDPDSQFGDDDLVVVGPIIPQLSGVYDEYWNSRLAIPAAAVDAKHASAAALTAYRGELASKQEVPGEAHAAFRQRAASGEPWAGIVSGRSPLIWARMQAVYDSPDKKRVDDGDDPGRLIAKPVEEKASAVSAELLMVTPYLVPSAAELDILHNDLERHVRIRILTNSLAGASEVAGQSGYMHYRPRLLAEGVELYEIRARLGSTKGSGQSKRMSGHGTYALHAKLFVFDRKAVFIGSMNFDERSRHLNTEIGLIVSSPELAREVAARFEALTQPENAYRVLLADGSTEHQPRLIWKTREDGKDVTFTTEPARSDWQRFEVKFLSLLPLEKEL